MKAQRNKSRFHGFSLVEAIVITAVLATASLVGIGAVTSARDSARDAKLESDVATLNSAVLAYELNGGTIPSNATASQVLTLLKQRSATTALEGTVGMAGSFVDPRVEIDEQTAANANSGRLRAVWIPSSQKGQSRFATDRSATAGILSFRLTESLAAGTPGTDSTRAPKLVASDVSGGSPKWIWDFSNSSVSSAYNAGLEAAIGQGFASGYFTTEDIDGDGVGDGNVSVSYLFREAGYNSRLGLFSMEGMGPDVYDLSTPEGVRAFLEEAIRRVLNADNSGLGGVIIDASQSGVGFNQQYQFRPGDTLAAILIPNASFQTALNQIQAGTSNSQTYPLVSLAYESDQAPFYTDQIAYIGENAYAIEDIPGAGSDNDYNDLIFTAAGLQVPGNATGAAIDPLTYYQGQPYWDTPGPNGISIKQALINAGVIPADS